MDLILGAIIALALIAEYERRRDPNKRDFIDWLVKWQWRE